MPENHNWIHTATGGQFFPLDPKPEQIRLKDIAHALSNLCRFCGHTREFYSVAQHSLIVANNLSPDLALWGLLHDASEAYICDIPRPIKSSLWNYKEVEEKIMQAVATRFHLPWPMPEGIHNIDLKVLNTEKRDLLQPNNFCWNPDWVRLPYPFTITPLSPEQAKEQFIKKYRDLTE